SSSAITSPPLPPSSTSHTTFSYTLSSSTATPTTYIYTLSLHDALPILASNYNLIMPSFTCIRFILGISFVVGMHKKRLARSICRSEEHTSELQSRFDLVCRLLLEKKNINVRLPAGWGDTDYDTPGGRCW